MNARNSAEHPSATTTHSTMDAYTICPYRTEDMETVLSLIKAAMGETEANRKTEGFWTWKHHDGPFGPSFGLCAWAREQHQMVGVRMLLRWQFSSANGETFQAARAVDTATHPNHQRRGIFSNLTHRAIQDLAEEGVDFIYNTPNQKSLPGYLKLGWRRVTDWPLYLRPLQPWRMAGRRMGVAPVSSSVQFEDYFGPQVTPWQPFLERWRDQLEGFTANWESQRCQVGLRTPRDLPYLSWRYGEHPNVQYGFFVLEGNQRELLGIAILRPNLRYGWQEIVLSELFLARPDAQLGRVLLRRLVKAVKGDYLIAHFSRNTMEHALLRRNWFLTIPGRGMTFTVRTLQADPAPFDSAAFWDVSLGDLELF